MARGSSYGEKPTEAPSMTPRTTIPKRATRVMPALPVEEDEPETQMSRAPRTRHAPITPPAIIDEQDFAPSRVVYYGAEPHPLTRHRSWLTLLLVSVACVVIGAFALTAAGIYLRQPAGQIVSNYQGGQSFPVQVGGSYGAYQLWENSTGPIAAKTPLPTNPGPYSVLGKPTISAAFINQVLASYNSPTAGMGQDLYDLGVKYGIDPVYALAFFMHESLFGTTGEARATLSLGNERCIPDRPCIDQDRGGYAKMNSWQDGFEQWYKLIRNLYVAQWGRVTVDQIIPKYAPNSDGNDEASYIAALKHTVDTWRAGTIRVT
jgi:hypothetical protein